MQPIVKREGLKRSKFHARRKEVLATLPKYEARAVARFVRISPRKARAVINSIRGKNVSEAYTILEFLPKKAARLVYNVLKSAVANATNNFGLSEDNLYIAECYVNDGPRMKRVWPRGRGRADIIQKRMSHITVVVRDREKEKEQKENAK
ncbi:LSU ribosomal protein L22P [Fervidobacterium changbaicum]|uniref:Large ribosomal subunit protein uL22 n=1 Tax=Fervidobacterium changbaicum TaxID=310769 RepID=A0ABX5QRW4_9BACT|nr:50S ribosomal protein L22 [Fervidobacterium changbaicum]QAV33078.1 50S ribosomal protein L22 [Fervidobacterium changbaicum]SDH03253.1 LSU ribosomal protein L22P [Fervidobacterium changbaicum]